MRSCETCRHTLGCGYCFGCNLSSGFHKWEPKPMTNADRIRAMSDEDLAIILTESFGCPPDGEQKRCFGRDIKCYDCALEWLKEEVKDV